MTGSTWSVPGGAEAPPAGPAAPEEPVAAAPRAPSQTALLRRRGVVELLDVSLGLVRDHLRLIVGLAALAVVPVEVLSAVFDRAFLRADEVGALLGTRFLGPFGVFSSGPHRILVVVLQSLALAVTGAAVATWVDDGLQERSASSAPALLGRVLRRGGGLLAVWAVGHLLLGASVLAIGLGPLVVLPLLLPVMPCWAIERHRGFDALGRGMSLARRGFGYCVAVVVLTTVETALVQALIAAIPVTIASEGGSGEYLIGVVGTTIAQVAQVAITATTAVACYLQLRVRSEGLDLELAISDVFGGDR